MGRIPYAPEEVVRRGRAIYDEKIGRDAELLHADDFVAIDIEPGDFEVAAKEFSATKQILARHPDAVLYFRRVGSPYLYRTGSVPGCPDSLDSRPDLKTW